MNGNGFNPQMKAALIKYAAIVGVIVGAFAVLGGGGLFLYSAFAAGGADGAVFHFDPVTRANPNDDPTRPGGNRPNDAEQKQTRTTALILGVNDGLADTMFVLTYEADTGAIDVISLPRDTRITLPQEDVTTLRSLGRRATPQDGDMKLNELYGYAGAEYGADYVRAFVERMLDIKIDYYVVFSNAAFRNVVDLVGGVEVEVPSFGAANGMHYVTDEGLVIDLYPGVQHLNGKQAEGFVRWRHNADSTIGYAEGDLGRVETQQKFMKAFFEQALAKDKIRENWLGFASTFISYVRTDFGLDDVPQYLPAFETLNPSGVTFHMLPGEAYHAPDRWYFLYDKVAARAMVDEIFYSRTSLPSGTAQTIDGGDAVIDKSLNIEILNGTTADGLAGRFADALKADGYNVSETGTYEGTRREETRVMARDKAKAAQFAAYFKNAVVETDGHVPQPFDVIIIIGNSEAAR